MLRFHLLDEVHHFLEIFIRNTEVEDEIKAHFAWTV
jgi:hypothetical protein